MKVALDVESVLVDTFGHFLDVYNTRNDTNHTMNDIDSWEWVTEAVEFEEFMAIISETWDTSPLDYDPLEPNLGSTVEELHSQPAVDQLDVVTASPGGTDGIKTWLRHHDVPYDNFVHVDPNDTKADLQYTHFIDDKPHLADKLTPPQTQLLVQHPYNETHWNHPSAEPVETVSDAVNYLDKKLA